MSGYKHFLEGYLIGLEQTPSQLESLLEYMRPLAAFWKRDWLITPLSDAVIIPR